MTPPAVRPPKGAAGRWVRAVVTLAVGVAVGLAPYLGTQEVPFFSALLEMIPTALRDSTIPASAALMGIIAVAVQWYSQQPSPSALRWLFPVTLVLSVFGLLAFLWIHNEHVVTVTADGGTRTETFVIGTVRQPTCGCPVELSDQACIDGLSWSLAEVATCWGDRAIRRGSLLVRTSYLLATALFAALVAILVLRPPSTAPSSSPPASQMPPEH